MVYKIGTRASKLAMAQSGYVKETLEKAYPEHEFVLCPVKTTGDKLSGIPLNQIGTAGVFVREIEQELLEGTIDLAVHSMKDMETTTASKLRVVFFGEREDCRDALLLREAGSLADLKKGAVIGTGSLRRKYQLQRLRPDLQVVGIRGNIETRIRKMHEEELDGIILAAAGLKRLKLQDQITETFSVEQMLPAPAQGALGVQYLEDRSDVAELLSACWHSDSTELVMAERRFLQLTQAGCHQPVGAVATRIDQGLKLKFLFGDEGGNQIVTGKVTGADSEEVARRAYESVQIQLYGNLC